MKTEHTSAKQFILNQLESTQRLVDTYTKEEESLYKKIVEAKEKMDFYSRGLHHSRISGNGTCNCRIS